jgi:hypothetical protein
VGAVCLICKRLPNILVACIWIYICKNVQLMAGNKIDGSTDKLLIKF